MNRILSPAAIRAYDTSTSIEGIEEDNDEDDFEEHGEGEVRIVRNLSLKYFRSKLVEHFDIKFRRNELVWPRSRGAKPIAYFEKDSV